MEHLDQLAQDKYYMSLAEEEAQKSDYDKTKVGAIIVKHDKILSAGYNRLISEFTNDEVPSNNRAEGLENQRNSYTYHAEQDAVFSYNGPLAELYDSTIYITLSPCHECAKILVRLGIKEVIYRDEYHRSDVWNMSKILFDKCGVKYRQL